MEKANYLRERAAFVLNIDRLHEFNRLSAELDSGCLYFALLGCYQKLYPLARIPAGWTEMVVEKFGLPVGDLGLVTVSRLVGGQLGMRLKSIVRFRNSAFFVEDPEEFKRSLLVPNDVEVLTVDEYLPEGDLLDRAAILSMVEAKVLPDGMHNGHAVSLSRIQSFGAFRPGFQNEMRGGREEVDWFISRGYVPDLELSFEKCPRAEPVFKRVSGPNLPYCELVGND